MDRFEAAAALHASIVGAMRGAGMWDVVEPPAEAFSSETAFYGDTMSFEQWLRHVMLPNLQSMIDSRGEFPSSSSLALKARREYEHFSIVPEAEPVIEALAQLDAFIILQAATVKSLRFFEAAREPSERRYAERFASRDTRFIYWEVSLEHPEPGAVFALEFEEHWIGPAEAGQILQPFHQILQPGWRDSWFYHSQGWDDPDCWHLGSYRLVLSLWDEKFAEGEFVIE